MSGNILALDNRTLTTSGQVPLDHEDGQQTVLFWNIAGPITGTLPTIQFTLQEVDPSDNTTPIGVSISSSVWTTTGVGQIMIPITLSPSVLVKWTVGGTLPSFGGVSLAVSTRNTSLAGTQTVSGTVTTNQGGSWTVLQGSPPWTQNITQFGGNSVVTGAGAGGVGIPRVTVSNDSNVLATQSGGWTVTSNQGTPNSLANKWPVQITDGTNSAAVKASSTPPVAADPALVVVLSPNQPSIPVSSTPATTTPGISLGYMITTARTNIPVRATTYTEQAANFTGSVVSSSAHDSSAGTGARTIKITYLDQTVAGPNTETVTLNGTTAVNLVNANHCFIEKIEVVTVGTGAVNAGTISLFTGSGGTGTLVGTIAIGDSRTFWAHHYTPVGKTTNITGMTGTTNSSNQTLFSAQYVVIPVVNRISIQVTDWVTGSQTNQTIRTFGSPIKITGPARIVLFGAPGATANIQSYGSFDYYDQ